MLEKIKLLLGITDEEKDALLQLLIDNATDEVITFTNNNDVMDLEFVIQKVVVYNYNRLGTEGLDSEGYSGVSFTYSTDYPDDLLRLLKGKRKLRTL